MSDDSWILDNRPHTRTKLQIFKQYFDVWLTIWNSWYIKKKWVSKVWYYIDLFAGRGIYSYKGEDYLGSPLLFLDELNKKLYEDKFSNDVKIRMFLTEMNNKNFTHLQENINNFLYKNSKLKKIVDINFFNDDCNKVIDDILLCVENNWQYPLLATIDPYGIKIKAETVKKIIKLENPRDIFFNYILEAVRRVGGVYRKSCISEAILTQSEINTIKTFREFLGQDVGIDHRNMEDVELLKSFVDTVFSDRNLPEYRLKVKAFGMKYPDRNDIIYYLLFASKKDNITKIVNNIFATQKEKIYGASLWGKEYYEQGNLFD